MINSSFINLCHKLGKNFNYVQGSGGNISVKDSSRIIVKASGKSIAKIRDEDIFVKLNLKKILNNINNKQFTLEDCVIESKQSRPSIETYMHAIIPQKYVFHFHTISILKYLIFNDYQNKILNRIKNKFNVIFIDYHKPGYELGLIIKQNLAKSQKEVDIFFLKNHGIIIAASSIERSRNIINFIDQNFKIKSVPKFPNNFHNELSLNNFYQIIPSYLNSLAFKYYKYLKKFWPIYPDNVVFLGSIPNIFSSIELFKKEKNKDHYDYVIIKNVGVYINISATSNITIHLMMFYLILNNINCNNSVSVINKKSVHNLINWDAEKYRKFLK